MSNYTILDEIPKEGDYGINPRDPKCKPRIVTKSNNNLGYKTDEEPGYFNWIPLRPYHKKIKFN